MSLARVKLQFINLQGELGPVTEKVTFQPIDPETGEADIKRVIFSHLVSHKSWDIAGFVRYMEELKKMDYATLHANCYVLENGRVLWTRPINIIPAILRGFNMGSIGIILEGNTFNKPLTPAQEVTVGALIQLFRSRYPGVEIHKIGDLSTEFEGIPNIDLQELAARGSFDIEIEEINVRNLNELLEMDEREKVVLRNVSDEVERKIDFQEDRQKPALSREVLALLG